MHPAAFPALLALLLPSLVAGSDSLPLAECLRSDRIDVWHVEPERALLLRSGKRHFRVEMRHQCPTLGDGGLIALRGAQATRDFVCGIVGETALTRRGYCAIGRVTPLSRETYLRQVDRISPSRSRAREGT